jgi:hypothetical protein
MTDDINIPLRKIPIVSTMTVEQIATMCLRLSSHEHEVFARIEHVNGRPVAYLIAEKASRQIPEFLRR